MARYQKTQTSHDVGRSITKQINNDEVECWGSKHVEADYGSSLRYVFDSEIHVYMCLSGLSSGSEQGGVPLVLIYPHAFKSPQPEQKYSGFDSPPIHIL